MPSKSLVKKDRILNRTLHSRFRGKTGIIEGKFSTPNLPEEIILRINRTGLNPNGFESPLYV
jgi:hypothetical protein